MDYASRLRSLPGATTAGQSIGPGTATALMGKYAGALPGTAPGLGGGGGGMQMQMAGNAPIDDGQRAILDTILSAFSNAPRVK